MGRLCRRHRYKTFKMLNEVFMENKKSGDKNLNTPGSQKYTAEDISLILAARGIRSTVSQEEKPRDNSRGAPWGMFCATGGVMLVAGLLLLVFFR